MFLVVCGNGAILGTISRVTFFTIKPNMVICSLILIASIFIHWLAPIIICFLGLLIFLTHVLDGTWKNNGMKESYDYLFKK